MLIKIGAALSVMAQYIQRRGNTFQFCMRVPAHLHKSFGKTRIRQSLNTEDAHTAAREGERLARQYLAEFKVLTDGVKATPADVAIAGDALAGQHNFETFVDHVVEPLRAEYANGDAYLYDVAEPADYLSPAQQEALKALKAEAGPKVCRLSDAFQLYINAHKQGKDEGFVKKQKRDWNTLIATVGNIEFKDLSREHARHVRDALLEQGKKTATVRRTLTTLSAVTSSAIRELAVVRTNPFEKLEIQSENEDAKGSVVAKPEQLAQIVNANRSEIGSVPALLTLMQLELGARIGELSGLAVDDVVLDHETPHIVIRRHPWRSLKTKVSERWVPLVGVALEAAKRALALPRTGQGEDKGKGLFSQYAHKKGNTSASAAVNKRLARWGMTSHSFRHTLKDRLREASCPEDIRNAIQGHTNGSVAEKYGKGHSLKTMREWMQKVAIRST